jgi:ABC-type antimicrobial peptide transport system permease subunit
LGADGEYSAYFEAMYPDEMMALATAGTLLGLLGALVANRLLSAMLFEVSPTDGPTLGVVALILLCVVALASLIPMRSSTRIDPVVALQAE